MVVNTSWGGFALPSLQVTISAALLVATPTDELVGVAIPLLAFRVFTPGEVFPVAYRRLGPRFSATRFDVAQGGCVSARWTAPAEHRAQLTSEAPLILGATTRASLQQALDQRSDGRLRLDPDRPRPSASG